ncbi:MAG: ankyrin repeat domain-containing protein [Firmicutes bacterium]|nr:ankyrin repeat domain-containing protein [Bacillota bacterium]
MDVNGNILFESAFTAIAKGDAQALSEMLKMEPNLVDLRSNGISETLLHEAVGKGKVECIKVLIAHGADPSAPLKKVYNACKLRQHQPLQACCDNDSKNGGCNEVNFDSLMRYKTFANCHLCKKCEAFIGVTPLDIAVKSKLDEVAIEMVQSGRFRIQPEDYPESSRLLKQAVFDDNLRLFRVLSKFFKNCDYDINFMIDQAIINNNIDMVRAIVEDENILRHHPKKVPIKYKPLVGVAIKMGNVGMVKLLIETYRSQKFWLSIRNCFAYEKDDFHDRFRLIKYLLDSKKNRGVLWFLLDDNCKEAVINAHNKRLVGNDTIDMIQDNLNSMIMSRQLSMRFHRDDSDDNIAELILDDSLEYSDDGMRYEFNRYCLDECLYGIVKSCEFSVDELTLRLDVAVECQSKEMVDLLISYGASFECANEEQEELFTKSILTPVLMGNKDFLEFIIDRGANMKNLYTPTLQVIGINSLSDFVMYNQKEEVKEYLTELQNQMG